MFLTLSIAIWQLVEPLWRAASPGTLVNCSIAHGPFMYLGTVDGMLEKHNGIMVSGLTSAVCPRTMHPMTDYVWHMVGWRAADHGESSQVTPVFR